MDYNVHQRFVFADQTYVSRLKRDVEQAARSYGFNDTETGKVNLVVTEMASNVIKHAGTGGELLLKPLAEEGIVTGLELICLDAGAGMADARKMQEDGVSTYGSSGEGLGAIKRLADEYDLYSAKDLGTAVLARLYKSAWKRRNKAGEPAGLAAGAIMLPKNGEVLCGDNWAMTAGAGAAQDTRSAEAHAGRGGAGHHHRPEAGPAELLRGGQHQRQALRRGT